MKTPEKQDGDQTWPGAFTVVGCVWAVMWMLVKVGTAFFTALATK